MVQSPGFRTPEVNIKAAWDHQIDIWSFGSLMFVLLTGINVFHTPEPYNRAEHLNWFVEWLGHCPFHMITAEKCISMMIFEMDIIKKMEGMEDCSHHNKQTLSSTHLTTHPAQSRRTKKNIQLILIPVASRLVACNGSHNKIHQATTIDRLSKSQPEISLRQGSGTFSRTWATPSARLANKSWDLAEFDTFFDACAINHLPPT
ncbi:hypothetical protein PtA15_9A174 [Puccinia triticina]|uniref:Protein kinase domain-containing protein n=1 Tax=Puccinia triticina TaxID=208348 RepID=A0ABY7CRZ8_9BASI|nr:uncharacterized protein PtA15_9A174 [Puccinia triticina]WAQ88049.1 hypothetical protein PtA15_9A174 [Puccinia triticina]